MIVLAKVEKLWSKINILFQKINGFFHKNDCNKAINSMMTTAEGYGLPLAPTDGVRPNFWSNGQLVSSLRSPLFCADKLFKKYIYIYFLNIILHIGRGTEKELTNWPTDQTDGTGMTRKTHRLHEWYTQASCSTGIAFARRYQVCLMGGEPLRRGLTLSHLQVLKIRPNKREQSRKNIPKDLTTRFWGCIFAVLNDSPQ